MIIFGFRKTEINYMIFNVLAWDKFISWLNRVLRWELALLLVLCDQREHNFQYKSGKEHYVWNWESHLDRNLISFSLITAYVSMLLLVIKEALEKQILHKFHLLYFFFKHLGCIQSQKIRVLVLVIYAMFRLNTTCTATCKFFMTP